MSAAPKVIDLMQALKTSLAGQPVAGVEDSPDLLTVQDVAARLKVHPKTVIRLGIPYITVGTGKKRPRRRYRPEVIEAWIAERAR